MQSPEPKHWEIELNIVGVFMIVPSVETLFGHVTLSSRGQCGFSRLLNPDWLIQISGASNVCNVMPSEKYYHLVEQCVMREDLRGAILLWIFLH